MKCYNKKVVGKGLVNSAINKLPIEMHIPGYSYCGPGTRLEKRLARGDKGINELDEACKQHDIAYSQSKDLSQRHHADQILADRALKRFKSLNAGVGERMAALGVVGAMKAKVKLGMGYNLSKRGRSNYNKVIYKCRKSIEKVKKAIERNLKIIDASLKDIKETTEMTKSVRSEERTHKRQYRKQMREKIKQKMRNHETYRRRKIKEKDASKESQIENTTKLLSSSLKRKANLNEDNEIIPSQSKRPKLIPLKRKDTSILPNSIRQVSKKRKINDDDTEDDNVHEENLTSNKYQRLS